MTTFTCDNECGYGIEENVGAFEWWLSQSFMMEISPHSSLDDLLQAFAPQCYCSLSNQSQILCDSHLWYVGKSMLSAKPKGGIMYWTKINALYSVPFCSENHTLCTPKAVDLFWKIHTIIWDLCKICVWMHTRIILPLVWCTNILFMVFSVTCVILSLTLFWGHVLGYMMINNFAIVVTSWYLAFKCTY